MSIPVVQCLFSNCEFNGCTGNGDDTVGSSCLNPIFLYLNITFHYYTTYFI